MFDFDFVVWIEVEVVFFNLMVDCIVLVIGVSELELVQGFGIEDVVLVMYENYC